MLDPLNRYVFESAASFAWNSSLCFYKAVRNLDDSYGYRNLWLLRHLIVARVALGHHDFDGVLPESSDV
jgi:hypothetical protein